MRKVIGLASVVMLAACAQQSVGNVPVTETEANKIAEAAESSFTSGDIGKVMDQYADPAVMIDASAANPSADRKLQTGWTRDFVSMRPQDYRVTHRHIQLLGPDAFVSSGIESFTVAAGTARPTVSARFTDVFQRHGDGGWKIVHEHVSMPPAPTTQP